MSQQAAILWLLRSGPKTTNELLASRFGLASEYRSRIAELRGQGYVITCEKHKGGGSVWTLVSEPPVQMPSGQLRFAGV
jgi:hypothetical protein